MIIQSEDNFIQLKKARNSGDYTQQNIVFFFRF